MEYTDTNNEHYLVRSPALSDFDRVKQICEDRFGAGYIKKEEFEKWVADADFCKVAEYGGTVIGIAYLMPEDVKDLATSLKLSEDYVSRLSGGKKVIHCRCGALDDAYERRGVMRVMLEEILANIRKHGYHAVFAPAWTYNGCTPMAKTLCQFGFAYIGEKENLWYGMDGYTCIVCKGPCTCRAAIYQKIFMD